MWTDAIVRVVLHSHFSMAMHVDLLHKVGARAVLFDTRFSADVEAERDKLDAGTLFVAIGDNPPAWSVPWPELLAAGSPDAVAKDVDEDVAAFIQPTTGTTGTPKPWTVTHRSWAAVVDQNLHHLDTFAPGLAAVGPDDVVLHAHALQWATGFQLLYPYLVRGARTVLLDDTAFDPAVMLDTIVAEEITGLLLPAPMLVPLLDLVEERAGSTTGCVGWSFSSRRRSCSNGRRSCSARCGAMASARPSRALSRPGCSRPRPPTITAGWPVSARAASPFIEVAVVDEQGGRVPSGQLGQIVVRSAMSTGGYWGMPDLTERSFLPGGWFRPHDVGYLDDEGFLYYVDRDGDSIPT